MNEEKASKIFKMIYNVFIIMSLMISSLVCYLITLNLNLNPFRYIIIYIFSIICGCLGIYKLVSYIFNPYEIDFIKVLRKRCKK